MLIHFYAYRLYLIAALLFPAGYYSVIALLFCFVFFTESKSGTKNSNEINPESPILGARYLKMNLRNPSYQREFV